MLESIKIKNTMKKNTYYLLLLFISIGLYSCSNEKVAYIPDPVPENFDDDGIAPESSANIVLKVQPTQTHQEIDGFGCAFAEWSHRIYNNTKRLEVLDALFSDKGLGLNIFRGEAFPHYGNEGSYDFGLNLQYNRSASDPYLLGCYWDRTDIPVRLGQTWLLDELTSNPEKYTVDKFMFSTWSPPAYMKTTNNATSGKIKPESKPDFANYLADFVKQLEAKFNFKVYAISPTNEPNAPFASWSMCNWSQIDLADFIVDHLRPAFTEQGLDTKIIYGEHAWWNNGATYVNRGIEHNPEVAQAAQIAAGHGYSTSTKQIAPYTKAEEAGFKIWNTELSHTGDKEVRWVEDGLHWADIFEAYLAKGDVSAIVWWAGARPAYNNEPLIYLQEALPGTSYELSSRYYTFGHFSKFIPAGSFRTDIEAELQENDTAEASRSDDNDDEGAETPEILPEGISYTSYVDQASKTFTIVVINRTEMAQEVLIEVEGEEIENMRTYTSNEGVKWMHKKVNPSLSGQRSAFITATGVVTITGKLK